MIEFENYLILPAQTGRAFPMTPERNLVAAVMDNALHALHTHPVRQPGSRGPAPRWASPYQEALAWFESEDETWPFSFQNCCHILGFDPTEVRAAVLGRKAS